MSASPHPYLPAPPAPYRVPANSTNRLAIASLAINVFWVWWSPSSILALIFGYVSLLQIRERGQRGRGMAIAGIVIGSFGTSVLLLYITVYLYLMWRLPTISMMFGFHSYSTPRG